MKSLSLSILRYPGIFICYMYIDMWICISKSGAKVWLDLVITLDVRATCFFLHDFNYEFMNFFFLNMHAHELFLYWKYCCHNDVMAYILSGPQCTCTLMLTYTESWKLNWIEGISYINHNYTWILTLLMLETEYYGFGDQYHTHWCNGS